MAEFYATIQGDRGPKTCRGSKNSGVSATAQSWQGSISVQFYEDPDGVKCCAIYSSPSSTPNPSTPLWFGRLEDLVNAGEAGLSLTG